MERYRISRAVSVKEVSPHVYVQVRYDAYTNELGAVNLGDDPNQDSDFWPAPSAGLHYFRGGYEWMVDEDVKTDIITSGAATEANFTPCPGTYGAGGYGQGPYGGEQM
jgi:hypothetical protein